MRLEVVAEASLSRELRRELNAWMARTFTGDDPEWAPPDWRVLLWRRGRVVSHLEIVERTVHVEGQSIRVGGVGGVATRPDWRGQGLATTVLREAARFMCRELGVEFGLLICDRALVPFYGRLEWVEIRGPMLFHQAGGRP